MKTFLHKLKMGHLKYFIVINLIIILTLIIFSHEEPNFKQISNIDNYPKEFTFDPIYNNGFVNVSPIEYPHVEIAPFDIRYAYIPFKESRDLNNNKYDELFYANKRVAELLKWGNEMPIKNHSGDEKLGLKEIKDVLLTRTLPNSSWKKLYINTIP